MQCLHGRPSQFWKNHNWKLFWLFLRGVIEPLKVPSEPSLGCLGGKEMCVKFGGVNGVHLIRYDKLKGQSWKDNSLSLCLLFSLCEILNWFYVYHDGSHGGELLTFHTHTHTWARSFRAAYLTSHSNFLHSGWAVVPQGNFGIWTWQGNPFPWKSGLPSHPQGTAWWGSHTFAYGFPKEHVTPCVPTRGLQQTPMHSDP